MLRDIVWYISLMSRKRISPHQNVSDTLSVLGNHVRAARAQRRMTMAALARRAGVDARVVSAVERGDPAVSIGNALAVAYFAGVPLFGAENADQLAQLKNHGNAVAALLPARVREKSLGDFL